MEINTTASHLLPEDAQRSLDYYKNMQPDDTSLRSATEQCVDPLWFSLKKKQVYRKGVAFDSLSETPCHDVLAPLRRSIYARNGMESVTEYLCHPREDDQKWINGAVVEVDEGELKAPEPPGDSLGCILMTCDYLKAAGAIDALHCRALVCQLQDRSELLPNVQKFPEAPTIRDLHVASLFLEAVDVLYLGSTCSQPRCWDLFHGPLFHYLCQNPQEIRDAPPDETQSHFDWTPIVNPRLLSAA